MNKKATSNNSACLIAGNHIILKIHNTGHLDLKTQNVQVLQKKKQALHMYCVSAIKIIINNVYNLQFLQQVNK